jgi:hypothetical protein
MIAPDMETRGWVLENEGIYRQLSVNLKKALLEKTFDDEYVKITKLKEMIAGSLQGIQSLTSRKSPPKPNLSEREKAEYLPSAVNLRTQRQLRIKALQHHYTHDEVRDERVNKQIQFKRVRSFHSLKKHAPGSTQATPETSRPASRENSLLLVSQPGFHPKQPSESRQTTLHDTERVAKRSPFISQNIMGYRFHRREPSDIEAILYSKPKGNLYRGWSGQVQLTEPPEAPEQIPSRQRENTTERHTTEDLEIKGHNSNTSREASKEKPFPHLSRLSLITLNPFHHTKKKRIGMNSMIIRK